MTGGKIVRVCHTSTSLISQRPYPRISCCGLTTACRLTSHRDARVNDCSWSKQPTRPDGNLMTPTSAVCCSTAGIILAENVSPCCRACVADSTVRRLHPGSSRLATCSQYSLAFEFVNTSPISHTDVSRFHAVQCCVLIAFNTATP